MKTLYITILMALYGSIQAAEPIPVREPEFGESRPSWWLGLWMDHVVVIEGTIEWKEDREPEVQIIADPEVLEAAIGKKNTELFQAYRKFRIARIKPKKLLFASPGITSEDPTFAALAKGKLREQQFLLPMMEIGRGEFGPTAKNGSSGVFIFRYGSMMFSMPLVFDEPIPMGEMASANAVFKHRNRFDHRIRKIQLGEQVAPGQPATRPLLK